MKNNLQNNIDQRIIDANDKKELFLKHFEENRSYTESAKLCNIPYGTINRWLQEDEIIAEKIDLIRQRWYDSVSDIAEDRLSNAIKNDKTGWISMEFLKIHRAQHYSKSELYNKPVQINVQINANLDNNIGDNPVTVETDFKIVDNE